MTPESPLRQLPSSVASAKIKLRAINFGQIDSGRSVATLCFPRCLRKRITPQRAPKDKTHSPGRKGGPPRCFHRGNRREVVADTVVVTVRVTLAGEVPLGVTFKLENEQPDPPGKPLVQLNWTCWLNPYNGVTRTV